MTNTELITALVHLFDTTPALKAMCPKGLYWQRGLPNSEIAETGTATLHKMDADHQFNTGTDHPAEFVFELSGWFADDSVAFKFVELVLETYETSSVANCTILVTNDDVIDSTDQTWQGMVELTITAEMNG